MDYLLEMLTFLKEEDARAKDIGEICLIARMRGFVKSLMDQYDKGQEIPNG